MITAYRTDTRAGAGLTCHGFAALLHAHPEQAARERNDTVAVATRRAPADVVRFVRVGSGVVDACAHTSINPHEGGEEFGVAPLAALTVLLEGVRRSPHFFARPALEGAKAFAPSWKSCLGTQCPSMSSIGGAGRSSSKRRGIQAMIESRNEEESNRGG